MAGTLHPRERPRPTRSHAEVAVWQAMKAGLPDGWRAWHSLRLRAGAKWEGEGDFVVAVPGRGLIVLEVKGGQLTLEDGLWKQNGQRLDPPPRDQAQGFVRRLVRECKRRGTRVPAFGVACFFPDCEFSEGPQTGELAGIVLGRRDLSWLSLSLPPLVGQLLRAPDEPCDDAWIDTLHALWGETWVPHVRLRDRVEDATERLVELNEQQLQLLDFAGDNPSALVEGAAGTGKTILARELCLRRAAAGQSVLYVCFTDALANAVQASFAASGMANVRAASLRRYALGLTPHAAPSDAASWRALLLDAAAVARSSPHPDLLVVDEAQDFEAADWELLGAIEDGGRTWVFRDPAQRFWPDRNLLPPALARAPRLALLRQERNPPDVARWAASYLAADPLPLEASETARVVLSPPEGLWDAVDAEVARLLSTGARPSEIAVVSLAGQSRTELFARPSLAGAPASRADGAAAGASVVADTFLRLKGLERPFVVLCEIERGLDDRYATRMHIAVTRATAACVAVVTEAALIADPRLAALAR
jgi:hypothetical protein